MTPQAEAGHKQITAILGARPTWVHIVTILHCILFGALFNSSVEHRVTCHLTSPVGTRHKIWWKNSPVDDHISHYSYPEAEEQHIQWLNRYVILHLETYQILLSLPDLISQCHRMIDQAYLWKLTELIRYLIPLSSNLRSARKGIVSYLIRGATLSDNIACK